MTDFSEPKKATARTTEPSQQNAAPSAMPAPPPDKKETARITLLPNSPAKSEVEASVAPTARRQLSVNQVPMPLCWALVAISAMVLILQIWNYLS